MYRRGCIGIYHRIGRAGPRRAKGGARGEAVWGSTSLQQSVMQQAGRSGARRGRERSGAPKKLRRPGGWGTRRPARARAAEGACGWFASKVCQLERGTGPGGTAPAPRLGGAARLAARCRTGGIQPSCCAAYERPRGPFTQLRGGRGSAGRRAQGAGRPGPGLQEWSFAAPCGGAWQQRQCCGYQRPALARKGRAARGRRPWLAPRRRFGARVWRAWSRGKKNGVWQTGARSAGRARRARGWRRGRLLL